MGAPTTLPPRTSKSIERIRKLPSLLREVDGQIQVWHARFLAERQHQPCVPRCGAQGDRRAIEEKRACRGQEDQEDEGCWHFRAWLIHQEEGRQRWVWRGLLPIWKVDS